MYRKEYDDIDVGATIIADADSRVANAKKELDRARKMRTSTVPKRARVIEIIIHKFRMETLVRLADEFNPWWEWASSDETAKLRRLEIRLPYIKDRQLGLNTRAEVGRVFGHPERSEWSAEGREEGDGFAATAVNHLRFYHPDWPWPYTDVYLVRPAFLGQTLPSGCTVSMEINTSTSRSVTAACRMSKGDR